MASARTIGIVIGVLVCVVVVAGNVFRADSRGMSVFPDLVSMAIAPSVVYALGRRRRLRGDTPEAVSDFGVSVGAIAGGVFAIGLGLLTIYRTDVWRLWLFGSATAFGSVLVLSRFAANAAGHKRITAV